MPDQAEFTFFIRPFISNWADLTTHLKVLWSDHLRLPPLRDFEDRREADLRLGVDRAIREAALVVADISLGLPNVYYEIGQALALAKPLVLLRNTGHQANLDDVIASAVGTTYVQSPQEREIIRRFYTIPADLDGMLYDQYSAEAIKAAASGLDEQEAIRTEVVRSLRAKVEAAIKAAHDKRQVSTLSDYQLKEYFKLEKLDKKRDFTLYCRYDGQDSSQVLSSLLRRLNTRVGDIVIYVSSPEAVDEYLHHLLRDSWNVLVTHMKYPFSYLLLEKHGLSAYVSLDGRTVTYLVGNEALERTGVAELAADIVTAAVGVDCPRMLHHAAGIRDQMGIADVQTIREKGFAFDTHSQLWIVGGSELLKHIKDETDGESVTGALRQVVSDYFRSFANDYLNFTKYVLAFWPLDKEGLEIANDPVKEWLEELNGWANRQGSDGNNRPIDRVFIIPAGKCIAKGGRYQFALGTDGYIEQLVDFFSHKFDVKACQYQDRLHVTFNESANVSELFKRRECRVLSQHAILFSRLRYEPQSRRRLMGFRGVLQFQEQPRIVVGQSGASTFNLRYRPLRRRKGVPIDETTRQLLQEIDAIQKCLDAPPLLHTEGVPAIVRLTDFIRGVLKHPELLDPLA